MPTPNKATESASVKPVGSIFHAAMLFALVYPTVLTWLYFIALAESPPWLQQGTYGIGKIIQFAFPLVFVLFIRKERLSFRVPSRSGLLLGIGFGLAVFVAMLALYYFWLKPSGFFSGEVAKEVHAKLAGFGITSVWAYVALSAFYVVLHSLLEEYYWRWFVFGRLREHLPLAAAVAISSVWFAAHHVLVLAKYFGWASPATWLFSAGVAIGGAVWAIVYQRSKSLVGPWLSHLLVDAAIFAIGYDLMA
jgi:membrane protease YdiL (CAAX protease family)